MRVVIEGMVLDVPHPMVIRTLTNGTGRYYEIDNTGQVFEIGLNAEVDEWVDWARYVLAPDELQPTQTQLRRTLRDRADRILDPPPVFVQEFVEPKRKATKIIDVMVPNKIDLSPELVPEINSATGKARLGITRYKLLDRMYRDLVMKYNKLIDTYAQDQRNYADVYDHKLRLERQVRDLKANAADSEAIQKKMNLVIKEYGLAINWRNAKTMEDKLNLFFGALMATCRPAAQVEPDEIAD